MSICARFLEVLPPNPADQCSYKSSAGKLRFPAFKTLFPASSHTFKTLNFSIKSHLKCLRKTFVLTE